MVSDMADMGVEEEEDDEVMEHMDQAQIPVIPPVPVFNVQPKKKKTFAELHDEMNYEDIYEAYCDSQINPKAHVEFRNKDDTLCDTDLLFGLLTKVMVDMTWFDDKRVVGDFFQLRDFWMPTHLDTPIVSLSLFQIFNVARGAEWLLTSDIFFNERDNETFLPRFKQFLYLIKRRIYYLCRVNCNKDVMDETPLYVKQVFNKKIDEEQNVDNAGYESDEEFIVKRVEMEEFEAEEERQYAVTWDFIFEVNTILTGMDKVIMKFESRVYHKPPVEVVGTRRKIHIDELRQHIYKKCLMLTESTIVEDRRLFYQDMVCTDSYRRIYKRRYAHDIKCSSRAVLVNTKHPDLVDEYLVTSIADMKERKVGVPREVAEVLVRINGDSLFFTWSGQIANEDVVLAVRDQIDRDVLRNCWAFNFEGKYYSSTSFMAAFALLRGFMRWKRMPSKILKRTTGNVVLNIDISKYDNVLFH